MLREIFIHGYQVRKSKSQKSRRIRGFRAEESRGRQVKLHILSLQDREL